MIPATTQSSAAPAQTPVIQGQMGKHNVEIGTSLAVAGTIICLAMVFFTAGVLPVFVPVCFAVGAGITLVQYSAGMSRILDRHWHNVNIQRLQKILQEIQPKERYDQTRSLTSTNLKLQKDLAEQIIHGESPRKNNDEIAQSSPSSRPETPQIKEPSSEAVMSPLVSEPIPLVSELLPSVSTQPFTLPLNPKSDEAFNNVYNSFLSPKNSQSKTENDSMPGASSSIQQSQPAGDKETERCSKAQSAEPNTTVAIDQIPKQPTQPQKKFSTSSVISLTLAAITFCAGVVMKSRTAR